MLPGLAREESGVSRILIRLAPRTASAFDRSRPPGALSGGPRPSASRRSGVSNPPAWGGSEGPAMLNRTNRNLSANLHRSNLGTRSLAITANANNNGSLTLRTAHARHLFVDVRAVVEEYPAFVGIEVPFIAMMMGLKPTRPAMFPTSGSSPEATQLLASCLPRDQQGQPIVNLAIPDAIPVDGRTRRGAATRTTTPRRPTRTPLLGWRHDRSRRADRAAQAVLVSDAAP